MVPSSFLPVNKSELTEKGMDREIIKYVRLSYESNSDNAFILLYETYC